jgi:hypothetical protein
LGLVIDRIRDLLPIIRRHVSHPEFLGTYSIKAVAPALLPGFGYADLTDVADGSDASALFYRLTTHPSLPMSVKIRYRTALLKYCHRDTLAMLYVHRRLELLRKEQSGKLAVQ